MKTESFHVGLAPFRDANGHLRASYQALGSDGKAIGSVDLKDGIVVRSAFTAECDAGGLIQRAKQHFAQSRPTKCPQCGESIVQTALPDGKLDDYCEECGWPDETRL